MSRLIVKNIPNTLSEAQLKKHFDKVGEVTDVKVAFKGNKNRRFCFVGYKSEQDAQKAQSQFNNTFIGMSKVTVEFARTADDPELPRSWSKHSKGSSAYDLVHGQPTQAKKVKVPEDEEKPNTQPIDAKKEEKFKEFVKLMKQQSTGTMAWSDNINIESNKSKKNNKQKNKKEEIVESIIHNGKEVIENLFQEAKVEKSKLDTPAINVDTKRLYVTNIPYNTTEGEIRLIFEKYGTVISLKLPKGRGGTLTGFCFITFSLAEEAMRAYSELDNKIIMGRILHVRPAFEEDKKDDVPIFSQQEQNVKQETSSYKISKKKDMLGKLDDQTNWNTLFLNPNSILESISRQFKIKKRDILSSEGDEIAVRVALAETQIIKETKDWLKDIGMNLDFLEIERGSCERSVNTILVKNIQYKVDEQQLHEVFSRYGKVSKIYLSPNRALGIVQFENEQHAENAFKNLSYYKYQGSYFYLEWAPKSLLKQSSTKQQTQQESDTLSKIVYVKNLNFTTTEKTLTKAFSEYTLVSTKIVQRDGLSLGYGFIEFKSVEDAGKALRQKQNLLLDDHNLQLSQSKPKVKEVESQRKQRVEITPTNKIVIRNLAFEANLQEIRSLIKNYGEVKKVRLPKKLNGEHRGFSFIEFVSLEEAKNAYEALQNTHFYGRRMVIEYSQDDE